MALTIVVCVAAWLLGWVAFGRPRRLDGDCRPRLDCTVVVPARNESTSLPVLLRCLERELDRTAVPETTAELAGAALRVIVVDDDSSDDTALIASRFRGVEVVAAPELPKGWTGKSWACWTGAEIAARTDAPPFDQSGPTGRGEDSCTPDRTAEERAHDARDEASLIFLDADVQLEPGALDRIRCALEDDGGLVSVQPHHRTTAPYEQLSALFNVIAIMGVGAGRRGTPTGAFGPVMATSLRDYHDVGGHAAVRHEIAEDLSLAQLYRRRGLPLHVYAGADSVGFRMYPEGLAQLVEGWTKNFCTGAQATRLWVLAAIVTWVIGLGSAALGLVAAVQGEQTLLRTLLYALFVAQLWRLLSAVGRFTWWTWAFYPIALAAFFVVFARSVFLTLVTRNVSWRGRTISLGARSDAAGSEISGTNAP